MSEEKEKTVEKSAEKSVGKSVEKQKTVSELLKDLNGVLADLKEQGAVVGLRYAKTKGYSLTVSVL